MSEPDRLSLADLETYGRIWGEGRERRALCPFCGDEHKRDREHASFAWNADTGAYVCHRCGAKGLLEEYKTPPPEKLPYKRLRAHARPAPPPPAPTPSEPTDAAAREKLRALWAHTVPITAREALPGARYLTGRALPLAVARAARVRYAGDWYGRAAVVFPMQGATGRLVAAEARYIDTGTPKSRSAGPKSAGVFEALPGALEADGVAICEGPITALSLAACGLPAIALCGHGRLPAWLIQRFALRRVLLALDWGEQGAEESARQVTAALTALGSHVYRLRLPAGQDANDYLQEHGLRSTRAALDEALSVLLTC